MSVFDLFRGFFGVPGGRYGGDGRRDPFFDGMTHEDDEDDDEEDGFYSDSFRGVQQDPFDDAWRFGFSMGPNGMRMEEPQIFGQIFKEMEEIFSQLGHLEGQPGPGGHRGVPSIEPPPPPGRPERGGGGGGSSMNPLRDFMLKSPDDGPTRPPLKDLPPGEPRTDGLPPSGGPCYPSPPSHHWTPFSRFGDIFRGRPHRGHEQDPKEDRDLDSEVSSGGLDRILPPPSSSPPPNQPKVRSFFQSVTVTKVVKPDGSVEERRTVRDGQGNEETTVTRSGGPVGPKEVEDQSGPLVPGGQHPFSDLDDSSSLFSKFFGGYRR